MRFKTLIAILVLGLAQIASGLDGAYERTWGTEAYIEATDSTWTTLSGTTEEDSDSFDLSTSGYDGVQLSVSIDYDATPTDEVEIHLYSSQDGVSWDSTPFNFLMGDSGEDPQTISLLVNGIPYLKVGFQQTGSTDSHNVRASVIPWNYAIPDPITLGDVDANSVDANSLSVAGATRVGAITSEPADANILADSTDYLMVGGTNGGEYMTWRPGQNSAGTFLGSYLFVNDDSTGTEPHYAGMAGYAGNSGDEIQIGFWIDSDDYELAVTDSNLVPSVAINQRGNLMVLYPDQSIMSPSYPLSSLDTYADSYIYTQVGLANKWGVVIDWAGSNDLNRHAAISFQNAGAKTGAIGFSDEIDAFGIQGAIDSNGFDDLALEVDSSNNVKFNDNVMLGTATTPASATNSLVLANGTVPTGSVTNAVILYAEDVSSSSELKVRDEAGNIATLSANVVEYPADMAVSSEYPYVTLRENAYNDTRTYIALNRMAELVQELSRREGLLGANEYIIKHVSKDPNDVESWDDRESIRYDKLQADILANEKRRGQLLAEATEYERMRDALIADPNIVLDPNDFRSLDPGEVLSYQMADPNQIIELDQKASVRIAEALKLPLLSPYQKKTKPEWMTR